MKKKLLFTVVAAISIFFAACSSKESASSIAKKWCDLNGKVFKAEDGPAKDAAKAAREEYEKKNKG